MSSEPSALDTPNVINLSTVVHKFKERTLLASCRRPTRYTIMGAATALIFLIGLSLAITASSASKEDDDPFAGPQFTDEDLLHAKTLRKRNPQVSFGRQPFSLPEIVNNDYSAESWNGTWVSDTEYAYRNLEGSLALLSVVTGQSRTIVPSKVMNSPAKVFRFWVSADLKFVLLAMRPQKLFRHSFIAIYDIYNIATGARTKLQPSEKILRSLGPPPGGPDDGQGPQGPPPGPPGSGGPGGPGGPPQLPLMYAEWAPEGSGIAYVFANNIFYRDTPTSEDVTVTESGKNERSFRSHYLASHAI